MNTAIESSVFPVSLADQRREMRIRALSRLLDQARAVGNLAELRRLWLELTAACQARSPAQVARMERACGLDGHQGVGP